MKTLLLLLPILAFAGPIKLEKIVVGSKREIETNSFTDESNTIEDFSLTPNEKVVDSLEQLPGVSISSSGAPGQQSAIFIRSSEARHVLVLIDGVRVNDPSNTEKFFNPALLNVSDIERVEVLKGAQTLLYGSEAIGGVVNIITKKASSKNSIQAFAGFSRGVVAENTFYKGNSVFHLNAYTEKSEGISAAKSGDEKDGFENKGITLNLSSKLAESFEAQWSYKILDQFVETDSVDSNSVPIDANDDHSKSIQQIFSQKLELKKDNGEWVYQFGMNKVDRSNKSFGSVYSFAAIEYTNELRRLYKVGDGSYLVALENLSETFNTSSIEDKFAGITSVLFLRDIETGDWFFNYGLRSSYHTQFTDVFNPGGAIGKKIGESKLTLSYQKGFKSPTLYQLYGPDIGTSIVGNTSLSPELSDYFDLNWKFGNRWDTSIFYNKIDNIIQYSSSDGYFNSSFSETYGVEAQSNYIVGKNEIVPGIYLSKINIAGNEKAIRKPTEKATLSYRRVFDQNKRFVLDFVWRGSSFDKVGQKYVSLDPYEVINVGLEQKFKCYSYSMGIENLFGKNYEQVYGYNSQPFTLYLKMKFDY